MSEAMAEEEGKKTLAVAEKRVVLTGDEAFAVRHWWRRLTLPVEALKTFTEAPAWPKGVRANLRRCESLEAAMLTEAFRHLWYRLPVPRGAVPRDIRLQAWACIALVLAEVREERPDATLGNQLGKQKKETGKPCMSELRFQQLMECRSPEELILRLRRAVALSDRQGISVVHLADNIALWWQEYQGELSTQPSRRLGFLWANDYFESLSRYQRDSD